jgi:RHS repeat-associated protein
VAGYYVFSKAQPHLLRYETKDGVVLVNASTFVAVVPGTAMFGSPSVVNATQYLFQSRYSLLASGEPVGNVTITYAFTTDRPPKITAELRLSRQLSGGLAWIALTVDRVAVGATATVDFSSFDSGVEVATPNRRLQVGPSIAVDTWYRRLLFDWSDAPDGVAYVGQFAVGNLSGAAVLVRFPAGQMVVDPTLVGTSDTSSATDFTFQRKAFFYGGRHWAFWYDGSSIAYASSSFSYNLGQNTLVWSSKMLAPSGSLPSGPDFTGFDVDQRDGTVLVGYVPSTKNALHILKGSISGSFITWSGPYQVDSWGTQEASPPTIAIGTDGFMWAAVARFDGYYRPFSFRSTAPYSTSLVPNLPATILNALPGGARPKDAVVRILAMQNGGVTLLVTANGNDVLQMYRNGASGWLTDSDGDLTAWEDLPGFHATDDRKTILSATALPDDSVRIVYKNTAGKLVSSRYWGDAVNPSRTVIASTLDDTRLVSYPASSVDANGESHVFYMSAISSDSTIYYVRQRPSWQGNNPEDSWSGPETAFAGITASRRALTAPRHSTGLVGVLWTQGDATFQVRFGGVPTPLDFGSQTGEPWNRQGLSPYQAYFQHLTEFVSPGSGLLTVKQEDLVLPGRGLNLEISRVFITPRAFFQDPVSAKYRPALSLYEDYPWTNLGKGWQLNFPWLSKQYLHLWDGQMYLLRWQGDRFENHDGTHFVLTRTQGASPTYTLYDRSGIEYLFDFQGKLAWVRDLSGNTISFFYASGVIDYVRDAVGRIVDFVYVDGMLDSISSGAQVVSYRYETVLAEKVLTGVVDGLGRQTSFQYDGMPYLLKAIVYPTGAKSLYTWTSPAVKLDDDYHAFFVTLQDVQNSAGQSIRANVFDYTAVNGRSSYTKVTSNDAGVARGFVEHYFDSLARRTITIRRSTTNVQLDKIVSWLGPDGAPEQIDVYPGASASPSHSIRIGYDDWGNPIYTRDGIGHERFGSFANSQTQGAHVAPGHFTRTASGLIFFDAFEDRDPSDWKDPSGPVLSANDLTYAVFQSLPPALRVQASSGATVKTVQSPTFQPQTGAFWIDAMVRPEETSRNHFVSLFAATKLRIEVRFQGVSSGPAFIQTKTGNNAWTTLKYYDGAASPAQWRDLSYEAQQWYNVTLSVDPAGGTYKVFVNGVLLGDGTKTIFSLLGSGNPNRVDFRTECPSCTSSTTTLYVDTLKIWQSMKVTLTGLAGNQVARFYNSFGQRLAEGRAPSTGNPLDLFARDASGFPQGTVVIYDREWNLEFSSPSHEFWGGDSWAYTRPWRSAGLSLTRSGFTRASTVLVEDGLPSWADPIGPNSIQEPWDWGPWDQSIAGDFPVSGEKAHRSEYRTGWHEHHFHDQDLFDPTPGGPDASWDFGASDFVVQFLYIHENKYPIEVMVQLRDTDNSFEHRAYWGADAIPLGNPTTDPASRRFMGDLPSPAGRWLMLTARASDIGVSGRRIEGFSYALFGGQATWDFTARGDPDTGRIRITNMPPGWTVELYDAKPPYRLVATSPPATGSTTLDVYGAGIRAFPFQGFLVIKAYSGSAIYRSPVLPLWGGDEYSYQGTITGTRWYPNAAVGPTLLNMGPTVHDRRVSTLEFQGGRGASPDLQVDRLETHVAYDGRGLATAIKVLDGSAWRETILGYDPSGQLLSVQDPRLNTAAYTYAPAYGGAYVTQATDALNGQTRFAYDPQTGWLTSAMGPYLDSDQPPSKQRTRYEYDLLGRLINASRFDLPTSSEVLFLDMDWVTQESTWRMEDVGYQGLRGSGNHATVAGTTADRGKHGVGRAFAGTANDYLAVADHASLDVASAITVAGWVKLDSLVPNGGGWGGLWFDQATSTQNRILVNDNGAVLAEFRIGNVDESLSVAGAVPEGVFVHVAYTYDGSIQRLYINGVEWASDPASGAIATSALARLIGRGYNVAPTYFLAGVVDELRVFDRALSSVEIAALHLNTFGLLSSNEVAFDDVGNVATAYEPTTKPRFLDMDMESLLDGKLEDLAGRGYHGVLTGTTSVPGFRGNARDFDPSTANGGDANGYDYVTIGDVADFEGRAPFTVWARLKREADLGYWPRIVSKEDVGNVDAGERRDGWFLYVHKADPSDGSQLDNRIGFDRWSGADWTAASYSTLTSTTATVLNTWYNVAVTYDGFTLRMYVNGLLDVQAPATNALVGNMFPLRIGAISETAGEPFNGVIDSVQIFERALSAAEVADLSAGTERGFYQKQYFDSLGRVTRAMRRDVNGGLLTWEGFAYDFRDQIVSHVSPTGTTTAFAYDSLGRPVQARFQGPVTLRPNAPGSSALWAKTGCAANWDCVDEAQPDGAMTYVSETTNGDTDMYALPDVTHSYTIAAVTVTAVASGLFTGPCETDCSSYLYLRVNGYDSPLKSVGHNYQRISHTWATNPATGKAWTLADVNALQAGVKKYDTAQIPDSETRVTQLYVTVDSAATLAYDDVNRIRTVVSENGRKAQYLYDLAGRLVKVREFFDASTYYKAPGSDATSAYAFDEVGSVLTVTNALGQMTQHAYDNLNRLTKTTYPDAKLEQYTYDEVGNLATRMDRSGRWTSYCYDALDRLQDVYLRGGIDCRSRPASSDTAYAYHVNGNPLAITNAVTSVTLGYDYDALDRVRKETTTVAGAPYAVEYAYDPAGRLTTLTYPDASVVSYAYDGLGRTYHAEWGDLPDEVLFSYFPDDQIQDVSFPIRVAQSFDYNVRGWPSSIRAYVDGGITHFDLSYAYDASGNVLAMGSTSFTYDRLDRLKTAFGGFGSQFYDYDALGNRKRLDTVFLRPNGATGSTTTKWSGAGCTKNFVCVKEGPDHDGETTYVLATTTVTDLYHFDDLAATGPIAAVTVTAVARAECVSSDPSCYGVLRLKIGGSASDVSPDQFVGATYVAVSHTWTTKPDGTAWTDAAVDALDAGIERASGGTASTVRVTQVYVTVNVADSATYTYKDTSVGMNEIVSMSRAGGTTTYGFDAEGSLVSKTGGWTYEHDQEGLITKALLNGVQQQAYAYDGLGRRVKVDGADASTWTVSIVSGMDVLFETDESGKTTKYVYAAGLRVARIDCPPGASGSACSTAFYLGDALGSTRKVLSGPATTVFSAEYDPFGKVYAVTGTEAFKYTGEKHDGPTGLVYLRARQYDPDLGRFVSLDPVLGSLSAPQTLNRYAYVVNNPLKYTDPTGEIAPLVALAIILLVAGGTGIGVGVAQNYIPEIRPYTDPIADVVSFVPLVGDAYALGYYGTQAGFDCAAGSCDPVMVGINLGGSIPIVGDLGKAVKYGGMGIGFLGLVTKGGRHASDASKALRVWGFGSKTDALRFIRNSPDFADPARRAAVDFFQGATSKSKGFRILELQGGGYKLQFVTWSRNTPFGPFGKKFVAHLGSGGDLLAEYRISLRADGTLKWTWTHPYLP